MPIIGFNFDKITVEKKDKITGKFNIKNDVGIKSVEQEQLVLKGSEDVLKFGFEYKIDYEPKIGSIVLKGHILYMDDTKIIKEVLKEWKKNKKVLPTLTPLLINAVLHKSSIKALELSQDVNLPPHINLPRIQPKQKQ